eukprot:5142113-Pleurochrysis_carterae.AAC.1
MGLRFSCSACAAVDRRACGGRAAAAILGGRRCPIAWRQKLGLAVGLAQCCGESLVLRNRQALREWSRELVQDCRSHHSSP